MSQYLLGWAPQSCSQTLVFEMVGLLWRVRPSSNISRVERKDLLIQWE